MTDRVRYRTIIPDIEFWKNMVPCQAACPIHTDAGKYVQLIADGDCRASYLTARSPNPFASVCGRVCAAPCEDRCRRGSIDAPVSIRALKRSACERFGVESLAPDTQDELFAGAPESGNKWAWHLPVMTEDRPQVARGQKVAVIGAGPAGLACAQDLAVMGYRVTVFEATGVAGGMMYHGIPEFRLPRSIIERETAKIVGLGAELRFNSPLTADFGLKELRDAGFEAFFLAMGTQRGRDLAIEGADLDGVVKAIDFLLNVNHGYRVTLGKKVLVIGGGLVAFDAARMALRAAVEGNPPEPVSLGVSPAEAEPLNARQAEPVPPQVAPFVDTGGGTTSAALDAARAAVRAGVPDVRMISLESYDEMPALRSAQGREEFEEAQKEGVRFHPQRGARRITGRDGRVSGVELIGVRRTYDESGRFDPVYDESISETMEADTIILAIGQQADLSFIKPADGLELTAQRSIRIDRATLATSAPGIFAGGDVAFGPRTLIEAIANGKQAALSIDRYLRGITSAPAVQLLSTRFMTRGYTRPPDYEKHARAAPPTTALNRRTGISEVESAYSDVEARRQAERCLYCHIQTIYDVEKCVLCNRCVDVCPEYCLRLVPIEQMGVEPEVKSELVAHYHLEGTADSDLSAMIKDEEKCIRCGLCAIRCPTDAMTMEMFFYEESEVLS